MPQPAGLYIHVPFCEQKCGYCDFYSITTLELMDRYVEALLTEIRLRAPQFESMTFHTIFFGGGTPSLLSEKQLERIWEALHRHFRILETGEFTLEANPGTVTAAKLKMLKTLGINRISFGAQSFNEAELRFLGRIHDAATIRSSVALARQAGFTNINLDLMTAFPGITPASFQHSLEAAVALQPEHISCYTLIFEPGTVFYKRMEAGELHPLTEDEEVAYYQQAEQFLRAHGYEQYEISNFARGSHYRCQHNLIYWHHHPYLGLGPSAHSFLPPRRWGNVRSVLQYVQQLQHETLPVAFEETLTTEQLMAEFIFLHLRLKEGVPLNTFQQRFGEALPRRYASTIERLQQEGMVTIRDGHLQLTPRGWYVADAVASYF